MADARLERRAVLKLGASTVVLGVSAALGGAAQAQQQLNLLEEEGIYYFAVDIPGLPEASRNIREISIDALSIDPHRIPPGRDLDFRLYGPGDAHFGQARFTSACTLGGSKELQQWFTDVVSGKNIRKNITVTLFKSDKTPGRSYNLVDCFPTQWTSVNFDTSSTVQTATLTCKIGYIEFKT